MPFFYKIFLIFVLLTSIAFGNEYRYSKQISLPKDFQKKILVKYDKFTRLFTFRWTLYINDMLVVFHSYDTRVAQTMLQKNHTNQSFRVELLPRGAHVYNVPYLLVKFKEFNYEKNEALFEIFLSDKNHLVELQYLKES
jgi:hypothetical protein